MSRRAALVLFSLVCFAGLAAATAGAAEDILKRVPDSALGVVVLNRVADIDAKLQQLGREMQLPIPSLLAKLKSQGGLGEGLDEKGSAALIVLAPAGGAPWPTPVLLVPVTDYGKFLAPFKPEDAAEEVAKIKIGRAQLWVRKVGRYAALTDSTHKDALTDIRESSEAAPEVQTTWGPWVAEQDGVVVLFRPGIKLLSAQVQVGIQLMKATIAGKAGEQGKQAAAIFDMYGNLFQAAAKEASSVGFGLRLDGQGVLHLTKRARLVPGGSWARIAATVRPTKENLLAGLPAGTFLVAGGGVLPEEIWAPMMQLSLDLMKSMPNIYGLTAEQIDQMPKTAITSMKKVRGMSLMMGVGPKGASLYSKMLIIMRVEKSDKFMADYEDAIKQYAEFLKKVDSPVLRPIELEKTEIGGVRALQMTMAVPKQPAGMQTPRYDEMMEAMFGPGGKLTAWAVPADEHTVVVGYVDKGSLQEAVRAVKQGRSGLASDPGVAKTAALLPAGAPWIGFWSPRGTIEFVKQTLPVFAPPGAKVDLKIPEFPKTPPIGFALTTGPNELVGHMVVPVEVFRAVGQYAPKVKSAAATRQGKKAEAGNPVQGHVTLDGKPLKGAGRIRFVSKANADSRVLVIKDGKFEGRLQPGQYRVAIITLSVPEKYRSPQTTGLVIEVAKEGSNTFDFELKSD